MKHWLFGGRRAVEATPAQLAATGAGGGWGVDPVDGDSGWSPVGGGVGPREQPRWTTEQARAFSINAYRSNPMARAIIDTYTSFITGDSGVSIQCEDPAVRSVVDGWWTDPRNSLGKLQRLLCQDWMLHGEVVWEYMVGSMTGVVRFSPIDPSRVQRVHLDRGNPLWHRALDIKGVDGEVSVVALSDETELREGRVAFFPSWRALITDRRGTPFMTPILDDLNAYGQVLSNLVDRTALARYLVFDVEIDGEQSDVDDFITKRGGTHVPRSGSIEVHNKSVKWNKLEVSTGSHEDTNTALSVLTNVAGGAGLNKTWLAESEGANRATSLSMAEPVRRRINGVQNDWLDIVTESARFAIDRAVAVGRLPRMIDTTDEAGNEVSVPPSNLVRIVGPEIAAADATVSSNVMLNLSTALDNLVARGVLTPGAASIAAAKAWEQFVGSPMPKGLTFDSAHADDVAEEIDAAGEAGRSLRAV